MTLEPCAHTGRQPPCTEAILEAGISRVVYASEDPTDKASGRGPGMLRDGGVEVELANGPEASAARLLNQPFRKRARTGRPLVTYKAAMSLDGRVASPTGDSRWISSVESRELVHRWRAECDAVAVGIGTALADDPLLTARLEGARPPAGPRGLRLRRAAAARPRRWSTSIDEAPLIVICAPEAASARRDGAGARRGGGHRGHRAQRPGRGWRPRSTSSGGARSRTCWSRAARPSPARSSTRARSTRCGSSSRPSSSAPREARAVLEGDGAMRIADGVRPLATELRAGGRGHAGPGEAAGVVRRLMFTGIIKELGRVEAVEASDDGARLRIRAEPGLGARPRATRSRSTAPA